MTSPRHERLLRDLTDLKLHRIAEIYQEVLNEAARKGTSMLEVLATLIGEEADARRQRALEKRILRAAAAQAKNPRRVQLLVPQENPQAGHLAAVRLRLRRPACLRHFHWGHRNDDIMLHLATCRNYGEFLLTRIAPRDAAALADRFGSVLDSPDRQVLAVDHPRSTCNNLCGS